MTKPQRQRPTATSTLAPNVEAINVGSVREPAPAESKAESPKAEATPAQVPAKKAVTVRMDTKLIGQAHAAVLATQGRPGGYASFNALVEAAVAAEVEKAEKQFNDGSTFAAIDGQFRRGRPLKSN